MTGGARVAQRPLYFRLLRIRHLTLRPWATFVLFEGSIGLAILLALADVVDGWAVLALPIAVAAMVKLNDIVAGALVQPLAAAQLRTARMNSGIAVGRSPVPRPSRLTLSIDADDAVADPAARPEGVVRGVAAVPKAGRRPSPTAQSPEPPPGDGPPVEAVAATPPVIGRHRGDRATGPHHTAGSGPFRGETAYYRDAADHRGGVDHQPGAAARRRRGNQGRFTG